MTDNLSSPPTPDRQGNRIRIRSGKRSVFGRHFRFSVLLVPLFLALLAFVIYFQINRGRQDRRTATPNPVQNVASTKSLAQHREITGIFEPNQTITEVLAKQGLSDEMIRQIVDCARPVYNLAMVKADHLYHLCFTQDGQFKDFRYTVDDDRYLTVYRDPAEDCLVPVMKSFQYETQVQFVSGVISDSLFMAVADIGEADQLALDLADIFGSDIDFNTDIQEGDSFSALIEKKYLDGKFSKNGAILAASVVNQQKVFTGYRFEDENGKPAYYAPDGKALKKSFLKSPLKVFRITSRFSRQRRHPILKVVRPHLGVDYAAPVGTPVRAVAAGVVVGAGMQGGSGRMVRLRHSGGYETRYLHLSRIAVRSGTRVEQGQVIGYVGSSGLSTGPHLDFRIMRNGAAINPQKVIFPPGKPVSPARFSRFVELRDKLNVELQIPSYGMKPPPTVETRIR